MGTKDFAVTVGINRYPGFEKLKPLAGAEVDATEFHAWVTSPEGGAVPGGNARLILSSGDVRKGARPTAEQVDEAFEDLHAIARQQGQVGRRLYMFFAGHGFSPTLDESALLMANAGDLYTGYHIAARLYANWFRTAAYFEEVVLFMDCCRENYRKVALRGPPWPEERNPDAGLIRYCYGFPTYWAGAAHEKVFEDGKRHGLFSWALLQGLKGGAVGPDGRITSASLRDYVLNNLPEPPPDTPRQEPHFELSPGPIVFAEGRGTGFPVFLQASGPHAELVLRDGHYNLVSGDPRQRTPEGWRTQLPRGLYQAELRGVSKTFAVTGAPHELRVEL